MVTKFNVNLGTAFVIHETVFFTCEVTLEILPPRDGSLLEFPLDHLSGRTKYTGLLDEQHLRLSRYRQILLLRPHLEHSIPYCFVSHLWKLQLQPLVLEVPDHLPLRKTSIRYFKTFHFKGGVQKFCTKSSLAAFSKAFMWEVHEALPTGLGRFKTLISLSAA